MAIGWMTILSNVPWSEVIRNAPAVADGAKKLWSKVGGRSVPDGAVTAGAELDDTTVGQLAALRGRVEELHAQMLASSELIRALAEQNAQLIARIETNRRRMLALTVFCGLTAVVAVLAWFRGGA